ncbi:hypothetical protein [Kitasatospora sp. NPDC059673]|uniref:hypothetical protein n=1 Tax=Kitasatospora sp. NPDC059673 TaxID=3346901 RepID=UPI0036907FC5
MTRPELSELEHLKEIELLARAVTAAASATWDDGNLQVTMVVSAVDTTEGLLMNWSRGLVRYPVTPLPSQVALVHHGWAAHMIFSPFGVKKLGLGGQP